MLVFGEHSRELISPEVALGLARTLCGKGAHKALEVADFVIVPNANPLGRLKVEEGYYCKRTNEDGVDLNRNWNKAGGPQSPTGPGDEMYGGPEGFSEPETQLIKELVDMERPDVYVSIHSGAYLLGMPYGYTQKRTPQDEAKMMQVLKPISERFCHGDCPYGNLAELIHYDSPGCDIDYVYDKLSTPYVFTWEIFVGESYREGFVEEARDRRGDESSAFLQAGKKGGMNLKAASGERSPTPEAQQDASDCEDQFNPHSAQETATVIETWSGALLALCESVGDLSAAGAAAANTNSTQQSAEEAVVSGSKLGLSTSEGFLARAVPTG